MLLVKQKIEHLDISNQIFGAYAPMNRYHTDIGTANSDLIVKPTGEVSNLVCY